MQLLLCNGFKIIANVCNGYKMKLSSVMDTWIKSIVITVSKGCSTSSAPKWLRMNRIMLSFPASRMWTDKKPILWIFCFLFYCREWCNCLNATP